MNKEYYENIIKSCFTKSEICEKLGLSKNGNNYRNINEIILKYNIDISHFDEKHKVRIYEKIKKECPICHEFFETRIGNRDEKITCSRSCANTYFYSGENNPNYKGDTRHTYTITCFKYHKHECCVCKEDKIVEVHHLDGNRKNNSAPNLVPLCPTHHKYWHSKHRSEILDIVIAYMKSIFN